MLNNSSKILILIVGIFLMNFLFSISNNTAKYNVCNNFWDYLFINNNDNCWHESGLVAGVPKIILERNLSLESYYSVTDDGYILQTFRILPKGEVKGLILLEHSFMTNSDIWVDHGNQSLGLYLLDRGYEVWLGNLRGSKYSNTHVKYTMDDPEYWDWSFHEQGVYDMKSQIDLITKTTKRSDIVFIGYSMAGTSSVIYASMLPEHARNSVKIFINLGGKTHITYMKGVVAWASNIYFNSRIKEFMSNLRPGPLVQGPLPHALKYLICASHPFKYLCVWGMQIMTGWSKVEFDPVAASVVAAKFPDACSVKVFQHYALQYVNGGKMRMYDYGTDKNKLLYNSTTAPLYPLHKIKVPMFLYSGTEDYLTDKRDIENFYNDLPEEVKIYGRHELKDYNHLDLLYGKTRENMIYKHLLQLIKRVK